MNLLMTCLGEQRIYWNISCTLTIICINFKQMPTDLLTIRFLRYYLNNHNYTPL